jgi:hypothetical protein
MLVAQSLWISKFLPVGSILRFKKCDMFGGHFSLSKIDKKGAHEG